MNFFSTAFVKAHSSYLALPVCILTYSSAIPKYSWLHLFVVFVSLPFLNKLLAVPMVTCLILSLSSLKVSSHLTGS